MAVMHERLRVEKQSIPRHATSVTITKQQMQNNLKNVSPYLKRRILYITRGSIWINAERSNVNLTFRKFNALPPASLGFDSIQLKLPQNLEYK